MVIFEECTCPGGPALGVFVSPRLGVLYVKDVTEGGSAWCKSSLGVDWLFSAPVKYLCTVCGGAHATRVRVANPCK